MSPGFPYYFEDVNTTFHGTFSLKKIQKSYHDNYDYFKVHFLEGTLSINHVYRNKIYEEYFQNVHSIIALKKGYLQEDSHIYENEICFTSRNRASKNQFEVMVVNTDIEKKLANKKTLNWVVQNLTKNLFIGNEKYLLTIK
ncbi:hypothetical protein Q4571_15765 [Bacillus thuringiensis]|nr:hypothetical protein [Bacillus thuringiensis]